MQDDLIERLRATMRKEFQAPQSFVGKPVPTAINLLSVQALINPDGPDAADRIEALEAALSWVLIQLGSETGYNMESPIWHAYDCARSVLNGEK